YRRSRAGPTSERVSRGSCEQPRLSRPARGQRRRRGRQHQQVREASGGDCPAAWTASAAASGGSRSTRTSTSSRSSPALRLVRW
ncbi:unnamed protein product, partial [Scytosiphon promiscuus]